MIINTDVALTGLVPTQDFGPRMVLCPSGFINFALPKNLCTYQDIPFFKHPIGGGQLPKNVCKIL